jgi:hypothetical protein
MTTRNPKATTLNGREVHFAALSLRQLRDNKADFDLIMAPGGMNYSKPEHQDAVLRLALASLKHESPPVDEAFLLDAIDTFNFHEIITRIFDRNSFLAKPDEALGEAAAAPSAT